MGTVLKFEKNSQIFRNNYFLQFTNLIKKIFKLLKNIQFNSTKIKSDKECFNFKSGNSFKNWKEKSNDV